MRLLVVHAWMRGNLGDVLQLSVLLRMLRELDPAVLDLAGYPATPAPATGELLALVDRFRPEPFPLFWKFAPRLVQRAAIEPWWRSRRRALFAEYDAIVCAPGPYLADYDPRSPSALADIGLARDLGHPIVLSSHSIGPLSDQGIGIVGRASACVAREPATHGYLAERGVACTVAADYAFLYPYATAMAGRPPEPACRVVFLRSNNYRAASLRVVAGALMADGVELVPAAAEPLVLATSDVHRDAAFLAATAARLGIEWVGCRTVPELVQVIERATTVVSDRYHPAICAACLGKPARVLKNREPHKMQGLDDLLSGHTVTRLQDYARSGLDAVRHALHNAS